MKTLIQEIISWIDKCDKKLIIGISGHGAAGKTTFAHRLMENLKNDVNYLNTDPYIISSSVRKYAMVDYTYEGELHRFKMTACHPSAHYIPSLERDVLMLKAGKILTLLLKVLRKLLLLKKIHLVLT